MSYHFDFRNSWQIWYSQKLKVCTKFLASKSYWESHISLNTSLIPTNESLKFKEVFRILYSLVGFRPLCDFPIWRPMTMKFGDVILRQKLCQEIIKYLMITLLWRFHDVILYFRLCLGKKVENSDFFAFHPICLKFSKCGNLRC